MKLTCVTPCLVCCWEFLLSFSLSLSLSLCRTSHSPGHPFPLKGRFQALIFIHFEPTGHPLGKDESGYYYLRHEHEEEEDGDDSFSDDEDEDMEKTIVIK